jgi:hypothetical protein
MAAWMFGKEEHLDLLHMTRILLIDGGSLTIQLERRAFPELTFHHWVLALNMR